MESRWHSAFKALHLVFNAPLQWLVITSFKVQAVDALKRAPIASVSHPLATAQTFYTYQTAGDGLAIALGNEQQPVFSASALHAVKKIGRQIGCIAVL